MKGNIDGKQQQSILWFLGSNVNKVTYVTPVVLKSFHFWRINKIYENINIWKT